MDLGDLELQFPASVENVKLWKLKMNRGLPLQAYSQLIGFKLYYMNLANTELKLPDSITNIVMFRVTMSALSVHELCEQFQRLPHAVTFTMDSCTIHDYEQFIKRLKTMTDVQTKNLDIERISRGVSFKLRFKCNTSAAILNTSDSGLHQDRRLGGIGRVVPIEVQRHRRFGID